MDLPIKLWCSDNLIISISMPNPYGEKLHHRKYSLNGTLSSTNSMSTPNSRLRDFKGIVHAIHRNTTNNVLRKNKRLTLTNKYKNPAITATNNVLITDIYVPHYGNYELQHIRHLSPVSTTRLTYKF
jgi:hypothetical protein